jgi:hypothetical protein
LLTTLMLSSVHLLVSQAHHQKSLQGPRSGLVLIEQAHPKVLAFEEVAIPQLYLAEIFRLGPCIRKRIFASLECSKIMCFDCCLGFHLLVYLNPINVCLLKSSSAKGFFQGTQGNVRSLLASLTKA